MTIIITCVFCDTILEFGEEADFEDHAQWLVSTSKCGMVLTYDEYVETLEKQKQKQDRIEKLENRVEAITITLQKLNELITLQFGRESRFGKDKDETERKKRQVYEDLCDQGIRSPHWFID